MPGKQTAHHLTHAPSHLTGEAIEKVVVVAGRVEHGARKGAEPGPAVRAARVVVAEVAAEGSRGALARRPPAPEFALVGEVRVSRQRLEAVEHRAVGPRRRAPLDAHQELLEVTGAAALDGALAAERRSRGHVGMQA